MAIAAQVVGTVHGEQAQIFEQVVHVDVPAVFRGRGLIAAVVAVCDQQGGWNQVGETRRIELKDGGSLTETITGYQSPERFDYRLHDFKGPLKFLVKHIDGEWHYRAVDAHRTEIVWCYHFHARNALIKPLTWCFVRWLWTPYMQQVMQSIEAYVAAKSE